MNKTYIILTIIVLLFGSYLAYDLLYYEEHYFENVNLTIKEVTLEGAVNRPGEFVVTSKTTYRELFNYAGGLKSNSRVSHLNLDDVVSHSYLYINVIEEDDGGGDSNKDQNYYNLNQVTYDQLISLGISSARSKAIIEYREKQGRFSNISELLNVTGIGNVTYENIKNYFFI